MKIQTPETPIQFSMSRANSQPKETGNTSSQIGSDFTMLLAAQMMNQDPTDPMESNEVTSQLAQIASLEQQEGTNVLMQGLISMVGSLGNYSALNTVGKEATVVLNNFTYKGNGSISGDLIIDNANKNGEFKIEIKDESGLVIKEIDAIVKDGKASWEWDGTNSKGEKVIEGTYQISAYQETVKDEPVEKVNVPVTTSSKINAINFINGMISMENGTEVPFGNIISVATGEEKP